MSVLEDAAHAAQEPASLLLSLTAHCVWPSRAGMQWLALPDDDALQQWMEDVLARIQQCQLQPAYLRSVLQACAVFQLPQPSAAVTEAAALFLADA